MKTRNGFVSNSSSSSFLIAVENSLVDRFISGFSRPRTFEVTCTKERVNVWADDLADILAREEQTTGIKKSLAITKVLADEYTLVSVNVDWHDTTTSASLKTLNDDALVLLGIF